MYSFDHAYLEYFKCAADGKYDRHFVSDRLTVLAVAFCTAGASFIRLFGRSIYLLIEVAKILFYFLLTVMTFGKHGNSDRLISHIKLLTINVLCIISHSSQFTIHIASIPVGIISPSTAFRMMQLASSSLAKIRSEEELIWLQYKQALLHSKISEFIKKSLTKNFENSAWVVKLIMRTLVNEFSHAMDSGLVAPLGYMEKFHLFDANPNQITDEQKKLTPIILLNGNYSHQATFLPLLYKLFKSGNKRPIYTVNLPPNCRNIHLILEKVELIKKQYGKVDDLFFKIDMVGHSMGAFLIQELLKSQFSFFVNRVITLGTPCAIKKLFNHKKIFDITARNDLLILEKSCLSSSENKIEVDTGHLGLLFHKHSLGAVEHFLQA